MNLLSDIDLYIKYSLRQLTLTIGNSRNRDKAISKIDFSIEFRQCFPVKIRIEQTELTSNRPAEHTALHIQLVKLQLQIVFLRLHAIKLYITSQ